jgi:DNA-binding transcriptional regulator of glucitol operon
MKFVENQLSACSGRIAFLVVCLAAAAFMAWFLIALFGDGRRTLAQHSFLLERITIQRDR